MIPRSYQRFISDIAGQDIKAHAGDPSTAIRVVTDWLRNHSGFGGVPGPAVVEAGYAAFLDELPRLSEAKDLKVTELKFNDRVVLITGYLAEAA